MVRAPVQAYCAAMDRETLLRHLAQAERHVAGGRKHIAQQEELIAQQERDGHNTERSRELLATFLQTQRMHEEDHARILKELDTPP